jgi:hypothetical protein
LLRFLGEYCPVDLKLATQGCRCQIASCIFSYLLHYFYRIPFLVFGLQ